MTLTVTPVVIVLMTDSIAANVEYLKDGGILVTVGNRSSIVSSHHLVDERIKQLSNPNWGRPVSDHLTVYESRVIDRMKESADAYDLWAEVKEHYDRCRASGDSPVVASFHALYEWDLL